MRPYYRLADLRLRGLLRLLRGDADLPLTWNVNWARSWSTTTPTAPNTF